MGATRRHTTRSNFLQAVNKLEILGAWGTPNVAVSQYGKGPYLIVYWSKYPIYTTGGYLRVKTRL